MYCWGNSSHQAAVKALLDHPPLVGRGPRSPPRRWPWGHSGCCSHLPSWAQVHRWSHGTPHKWSSGHHRPWARSPSSPSHLCPAAGKPSARPPRSGCGCICVREFSDERWVFEIVIGVFGIMSAENLLAKRSSSLFHQFLNNKLKLRLSLAFRALIFMKDSYSVFQERQGHFTKSCRDKLFVCFKFLKIIHFHRCSSQNAPVSLALLWVLNYQVAYQSQFSKVLSTYLHIYLHNRYYTKKHSIN